MGLSWVAPVMVLAVTTLHHGVAALDLKPSADQLRCVNPSHLPSSDAPIPTRLMPTSCSSRRQMFDDLIARGAICASITMVVGSTLRGGPANAMTGDDSMQMSSTASTRTSSTATSTSSSPSSSSVTKPYASIEALLPATRVRCWIDETLNLAQHIRSMNDGVVPNGENDKTESAEISGATDAPLGDAAALKRLSRLLVTPPNFNEGYGYISQPVPQSPAKQYVDAYRKKRDGLNILAQPGAMLVQSGEIDTWKRLKRQERRRELEDETGIRAAMNAYTSSLSFSADSYVLNLPKTERSQMIREERLPDVKQVIASDMGLRLLYRNEVLTGVEDAISEMKYQLKDCKGDLNAVVVDDIIASLKDAQSACKMWFTLIDPSDVEAAMSQVESESRNPVWSGVGDSI